MDRLLKSVLTIREIKFRMDDDYVDRLSRQYSVIILVCFGFLVSTKQFVGRPITCWCPAQFTDSHRDYADAICWVSNTYYLPMDEVIPGEKFTHQKNKVMISYYQWVPLILLFQALLAFIPCLMWRFLNKRSGLVILFYSFITSFYTIIVVYNLVQNVILFYSVVAVSILVQILHSEHSKYMVL